MTVNPTNTIFNIKRLLGLKYSDKELQNEIKNLPYKVVNKDDHPYIQVEFKNETTLFSPEEIESMILLKMKKIAEDHIGCPVKNAVISIPASYNNAQRKATIDAATFAGINVVRLVTEPTMASLFYRINHTEAKKIITIDFGGGTFDSSVIDVENEVLDVISTNGDTHLGGKDFDDNVIDDLIKQYVKKSGKDPSMNYEAISKLKKEVEKVKCALSSHQEVTIEIENFNDGDDFVEKLTRARFEELNTDIFSKIITILQDVIKESKISKSEIDDIILTGSSTIIPKVQQIVRDFFDGKEPINNISTNEAVVYGAAVKTAFLSDDEYPTFNIGFYVRDVYPFSLGIENADGNMITIIQRNNFFPVTRWKEFTTFENDQERASIKIFEGEHPMAKDNLFLDSFKLKLFTRAPHGHVKIEVTFEIDLDGILHAVAEDKGQYDYDVDIRPIKEYRPFKSQPEKFIKCAEKMKSEDENL